MPSDLPHTIVPERLAKEGACLQGQIELRTMTRLATLLSDSQGVVDVELAFSRFENGCTRITGNYAADLKLVCQRCLEPVTVRLAAAINVGITFPEAIQRLPDSVEPLALAQETMSLTDFVEDEILLGMPIAPRHEPEDCAAGRQLSERKQVAPNPFHVLKTLKLENS